MRLFKYCTVIFFFIYSTFLSFSQEMVVNQEMRLNELKKRANNANFSNDYIREAHYYNKIAYEYWDVNETQATIQYFNKSVNIYKKHNIKHSLKTVYTCIGMIHTVSNEHSKALIAFEEAFNLIREFNNKVETINGLINLSIALENLDKNEQAIQRLEKALEISKEISNLKLVKKCYGRLSENYKHIGEDKIAEKFLKLYSNLNSQTGIVSDLNTDTLRQIKAIDSTEHIEQSIDKNNVLSNEEFEQIKQLQDLEIDLLNNDKIVSEFKIQEQNDLLSFELKIRTLLIIGIIILISIIVILYLIIRRRNSQNKKLDYYYNKFKSIFEDSSDAFLIYDEDKIVECNDAAIKLIGFYSVNDLFSSSFEDMYPEKQPNGSLSRDYLNSQIQNAYISGNSRFEIVIYNAQKKECYFDVSFSSINFSDKTFLFSIWRDIDKEKREKDKLQKNNDDLEEIIKNRLNELQRLQLFYEDLNNLKSIYIKNFSSQVNSLYNQFKNNIQNTEENKIYTLENLINDSQYIIEETSSIYLDKKRYDIFDFLSDIKALSIKIFTDEELIVDIQKDSSVMDSVLLDKSKVLYVIKAIFNNISQYTFSGKISFRIYSNMNEIIFTISDTGKAIEPDLLPIFFNSHSLYQKHKDSNLRVNSIELCLANQYVQLHNGQISVQNKGKSDEGVRFTFSISENK